MEKKRQIIKNGRPTPELWGLKQKGTKIIRTFETAWYSKKEWLYNKKALLFPMFAIFYI
jgi:hypothetical protein